MRRLFDLRDVSLEQSHEAGHHLELKRRRSSTKEASDLVASEGGSEESGVRTQKLREGMDSRWPGQWSTNGAEGSSRTKAEQSPLNFTA